MNSRFSIFLTLTLAGLAVLVGGFYGFLALDASQPREQLPRLPHAHDRGGDAETEGGNPGTLTTGPGNFSDLPGRWPGFRGPNRDGKIVTDVPLRKDWPEEGPPVLWRMMVGEGHGGPAVFDGAVYLTDYDREREEDAVRCLSLATGEEIWRYSYSESVKRNHGMSRTVPAVHENYVVSFGPLCQVVCLDRRTGEKVWDTDLVEDYGATVPPWYAGQCPLIEGDTVVLAPGGSPLMFRADLATGDLLWRTAEDLDDMGMTHASIRPVEIGGLRQYVYCSRQGVVSVAASDGRLLWQQPDWKIGIATVPSPVWWGGDRIFFSGGYNAGSMMIRVLEEGGACSTETLFRLPARVFGADQQTPIYYEGQIYGVAPKPAELVCLSLEGERLWSSGAERRFGLGPYVLVNDSLLLLEDKEGILHMVKAGVEGYVEEARADVLDGHDAWAPPAFAGGLFLVRDLTELVCLDLRDAGASRN